MAEIRAFKGIVYNKKKVKNVSRVFSSPYDVISPKQQNYFYRLHPNNVVRLILGKQYAADTEKDNRYTRAARYLENWLEKGILRQDEQPTIYAYLREYILGVKKQTIKGFISLVRLGEKKKRQVLPHENTHAGPKEDRFALLQATRANLGLIYSLFDDRTRITGEIFRGLKHGKKKRGKTALFRVKDHEGTIHILWRITDFRLIEQVKRAMERAKIMIADGHHRYETALNYRDRLRSRDASFSPEHPANFRMLYFADINDPGLTILPTHRIVSGLDAGRVERLLPVLKKKFFVESVPGKKELFAQLICGKKREHRFGLFTGAKFYLLRLKSEKPIRRKGESRSKRLCRLLDVSILHRLIMEPLLESRETAGKISYTHHAKAAIAAVRKDKKKAAFFLNPTRIEEVRDIAFSGEKMPPKSTYFYPKLLTGLVLRQLSS